MVNNYEFQILELLKIQSHPDSVEWCPVEPYKHYFTCATYKLTVKDSSLNEFVDSVPEGQDRIASHNRSGQIYTYEIQEEGILKLHQIIETYAILDMKWCNFLVNGDALLATATASGKVIVWKLCVEHEDESCRLKYLTAYELENPDNILVLSLDWSTGYGHYEATSCPSYETLTISDSSGTISVLRFTSYCQLVLEKSWNAHEYEAWITTYNYWDRNIIFSGGDDGVLKVYDIRLSSNKAAYENKDHAAGVTSLRCNHMKDYSFVSGSYDENVKLWDTRQMKHSVSSLRLNGGIWRLKWHPMNGELLLTAAMYGGFHLVANENGDALQAVCSWKLSDSLSYGADLCYLSDDGVSKLFSKSDKLISSNDCMLATMCTYYDDTLILSLITPFGYEKLD